MSREISRETSRETSRGTSRGSSQQPARLRLGCIADDVTGASDLANNLVRSGLRTVQVFGVPEGDVDGEADAVVVALKSRTIPAADAVAQSLAALAWLRAQGAAQVYFKYCSTFDSTPAGNIGPVIDALLDALDGPGAGFTIACPAFPENGRTVYQGHLFVGDRLLSESGMRQHPLTPMTDPDLVRVLQAQTRRRVGLVAHAVVARGAAAIAERFAALRAEGIGVAVVDAVCDADLQSIGAALAGLPLVTAGSGIALGLAQNWPPSGATAADALPPARGLRTVIAGSCSVATNAQVAQARARGFPSLRIDPLELARHAGADEGAGADPVAEALNWARHTLVRRPELPLLIHATADPAAVQAAQQALGVERAGALVEAALARIAVGLVDLGVRQLVLAGGETSGAVVQALGIRQTTIGPQIEPGVPWTAARSPVCGGELLHVAMKSGNFGGPDFFADAFGRLTRAVTPPRGATPR